MAFMCAGLAWGVVYYWWCPYWWCPPPRPSSWQEFLSQDWPPLVSLVVLFVLHFFNYWRVRNRLTRLVESALATHFGQANAPAVIFVDCSALKRKHRSGGRKTSPPR